MKVGFIVLGSMGLAVSKNILRAGFNLIVNDLRKELSESLIRIGAGWSETPAEMLDEVDVVATMVFGPKEIEERFKERMVCLKPTALIKDGSF